MVIKCPATPKNHLDNPGAYELNHHPLFEPGNGCYMGHPATVVGFKQIGSCSCWPAISLLGDWLMTRAWGMIECDMSSTGSCA